MQKHCISTGDVRFIQMYDDYISMVARQEKISYIAATLSRKYGISIRQFYYLIKRLSQDCNFPAP
ncbi:MAG: hypothetical protein IJ588_12495 [Prevotella sp.]|nr:hypothetical protein [Prevotella sp.]